MTATDLAELQRMLAESGAGVQELVAKAKTESEGSGLFVRSLIDLDGEAAKRVLSQFTAGKTLAPNQIEFVNLIIDHLTEHGVMRAELLYESPFTDVNPQGPEGVFASAEIDQLIAVLEQVRLTASA